MGNITNKVKQLHEDKNLLSKRVLNLFNQEKLLIRAMSDPMNVRYNHNTRAYDFTTWAREYDIAEKKGLTSASCTLLVPNETVYAYKGIGFLLDSTGLHIEHIAEDDSCSMGNAKNNDFFAFGESLGSLEELASIIKTNKTKKLNEVNATLKGESYIGIFALKGSESTMGMALLSQTHFFVQTNKLLPVFEYDAMNGQLTEVNFTKKEHNELIRSVFSGYKTLNENGFVNMYYDMFTKENEITTTFFDGVNKVVEKETFKEFSS